MHDEYFSTRFAVTGSIPEMPSTFVVVSAFATTGETWSDERNHEADARLRAELEARRVWFIRMDGYSPSTGHREPGFACELPLDEGIALGRAFHQDAIFFVDDGELSVVSCGGDAERGEIGDFFEHLDSAT